MSSNPSEEIRLCVKSPNIPYSLGEGTRSNPNLHMVSVSIIHLTPETHFSSNYIVFIIIVFYIFTNILIVKIEPCYISSIVYSKVISHSHIKIKRSIIGNNYFLISFGHSSTPPMNNISLFDINFGIHPIHWSFVFLKIFYNLMLFFPIVSLYLIRFNIFVGYKLCFIG